MKVYVMVAGEVRWVTNGLTFETVEEARTYAGDLFSRWLATTDWAVAAGDSTEPLDDDELALRGVLARR